jgi:predicted dehydrogenase
MAHRMGIIGYGRWGENWHHTCTERVEGLSCTAVYDPDPDRRRVAAEKGLLPYDTVEEFLREGDFDIVTVATPNNYHKDMSIAAMANGRHVVCEKPVAMNTAELTDMMAAAEKYHVLFSAHQNRRWDKDYQIIRKVLEDGLIGQPYVIESRMNGAGLQSGGILREWRSYTFAGGGLLYDWGSHLIDQILFLVNKKVVNVYACLRQIKCPEADDYFKIILKFENGLLAQIESGSYCVQPMFRWYVHGDAGSVYIENLDSRAGKVLHTKREKTDYFPLTIRTAEGPVQKMHPAGSDVLEEMPLPEIQSDWTSFYMNFMAAIDGKEALIVHPEQSLRVMKVIDACFLSSASGRVVEGEI